MKYCPDDCPYISRTQVPYSGNSKAQIVIVGESPGTEEEKLGKPFVGLSGQLLMKMFKTIGIERSDLIIANACRCRINKNNDSIKAINTALKNCRVYLTRLIHTIQPKLIIALGAIALKQVLGLQKIREYRGTTQYSREFDCPVFITYHPAYLIRLASKNYPDKPFDQMTMEEKVYYSDFQEIRKLIKNNFKPISLKTEDIQEVADISIDCSKVLAIDVETSGNKPMSQRTKLLSWAVCNNHNQVNVVLFDENRSYNVSKNVLENPKIQKVVAARPFDEAVLKQKAGIEMKGIIHDVLQMAHLVDENYHKYSLEEMCNVYTDMKNIKEVAEGQRTALEQASKETLVNYNGIDALATMKLYNVLKKKIMSDKLLYNYYAKFILPVQDTLSKIYYNGCKIDIDLLRQSENEALNLLGELHRKAIAEIPSEIKNKHAGKLSLTRNELILDYLFLHPAGLKLKPNPEYITSKTKKPQATEAHLKQFRHIPFVDYLLEWKKLYKIYSSFLVTLWDFVHEDGYVYPTTTLTRTTTGRSVMLSPAIQTVPQHSKYSYLVKRVYTAEDGWVLCARDLAQSELRIMAWLSGDKNMLKAIHEEIDLHTKTASIVNNISMEEVTKEMRQSAKATNFGFIYGMHAKTFVAYAKDNYNIDYTLKEAEYIRERFFSRPDGYYSIPVYHERIKYFARKHGFVRSVLGRKRRLPYINSQDYRLKAEAERQAINFAIQSFSSDLTLIGLMLFTKEIEQNFKFKDKVKPMFFIHDSIMFRAKENLLSEANRLLKECMEVRAKEYIKEHFKVEVGYPIESDAKVGRNWADMKSWDD